MNQIVPEPVLVMVDNSFLIYLLIPFDLEPRDLEVTGKLKLLGRLR
jgi:hypothetical protein